MKPGEARPPATKSLGRLRAAAKGCRACPLYRRGTQTVFGRGAARAALFLVGEQPGDREDRAGEPFVGPSGEWLQKLMDELGIPREELYVTNAVKHFKWRRAGKRRLHQKPDGPEIRACHPWLEAELRAVRPRVILCLGATAARSVLGRAVPIAASRGKSFPREGAEVFVTWHPSAILRNPTPEGRAEMSAELKADLKRAWARARGTGVLPRPRGKMHPPAERRP